MTASEIVQPFLDEPWLTYASQEPSAYAVNIGLPAALKRAEEYPMRPGVVLDCIDDSTPDGVVRHDGLVPASGQALFHYRPAEPKHPNDPRVVYYVHGGGFVRGNGQYCRAIALWALREMELPVYATEYRLAPDHKWPANLEDVQAGWDHLTGDLGVAPENIITLGDSAGATLTAGLCMRFKRLGRPLPGWMAFLSGALDCTFELPAHKANAFTDPLFKGGISPDYVNLFATKAEVMNPELSPFRGDWTGFPPLYFAAGESEVMLSDSLETASKAHRQGVDVRCHVFHGMWHDWVVNDREIPESYAIGADLRRFIGLPRAGE
ncbi:MAG: alpha/beta hydrolase [Bifidobacteriaceae bacterium]|jgi:acetyl esterase/lipase|nr:alpha/beta hydrolase [Bifidobacteriaceae bacterium]